VLPPFVSYEHRPAFFPEGVVAHIGYGAVVAEPLWFFIAGMRRRNESPSMPYSAPAHRVGINSVTGVTITLPEVPSPLTASAAAACGAALRTGVLKAGGRFAIFDVVSNGGEPHYPVPWARTPATSFLLTAVATREAIEPAGFRTLAWQDDTEAAKAWATQLPASGPLPSPNLGVVMGRDFAQLSANLGRSLMEGRLGILTAVFEAASTKTRIHMENR